MRRFALGAVVLSAALVVAVALIVVRTERTLRRSRMETTEEARIDFDLIAVHSSRRDFVSLGAPNWYAYGAVVQGKTVLAGPGGLTIGLPGAANSRQLRTGVELPAAPITALAVGMMRGASRPQLIMATRGEGMLFFEDVAGGAVWQLRPKDTALRDLTAVAVLTSGELLIGTRNSGLLRYDGKTLSKFSAALDGVPVTTIAVKDAEFWVGTRDRGVFWWHAGQIDHLDGGSGLSDQQVESIAFGRDRGVFVGTPLGVDEFVGSELSLHLTTGTFAHAMVFHDDALYIATLDQGIFRMVSPDVIREHGSIRTAAPATVKAESFLVADDSLFAVTTDGVLEHGASGTWSSIRSNEVAVPVLADRNVSALSFAPDGSLWVGYFDHGLDVVNLAMGTTKHTEDDHVFCVNRIVADPSRGTVDVATANGLVLFDAAGRERQVMMRRDGLIADQVTDVAFTTNGTVVATPAGMTFVDASGVSSLYGFQGLVNNHVYALASDAATGTLMAGTLGGISVLADTAVLRDAVVKRNLTTKNSGLKQNWITAIAAVPASDESGKGKQWWFVGTYGAGVVELDAEGQFSAMDGATRVMEVNPNAMLVTGRHVFVGSLGDGLYMYDLVGQRWSQVTDGLPSLNVTAFAEHDGELYVGTENGVVHIAEARLAP